MESRRPSAASTDVAPEFGACFTVGSGLGGFTLNLHSNAVCSDHPCSGQTRFIAAEHSMHASHEQIASMLLGYVLSLVMCYLALSNILALEGEPCRKPAAMA